MNGGGGGEKEIIHVLLRGFLVLQLALCKVRGHLSLQYFDSSWPHRKSSAQPIGLTPDIRGEVSGEIELAVLDEPACRGDWIQSISWLGRKTPQLAYTHTWHNNIDAWQIYYDEENRIKEKGRDKNEEGRKRIEGVREREKIMKNGKEKSFKDNEQ